MSINFLLNGFNKNKCNVKKRRKDSTICMNPLVHNLIAS